MKNESTVGMTEGNTGGSLSDEAQILIDDAMEQAGDSPEQIAENEAIEQAGTTIPTKELLSPAVALLCAVAVPNWEISQPEQDALCDCYAALIDKYFPDGLNIGPEMAAIGVTAAIVVPRLGQPRQLPVDEPKQDGGDNGQA